MALLAIDERFEVVGIAESLPALFDVVERERPDVLLTDVRMPPTSTDEGISAASALRRLAPTTGVVVVSQHAEVDYALRLLEGGSGRRAYLLKERLARPTQLFDAIVEVHRGGSVVDPLVVELLVSARRPETALSALTVRELEVLTAMAEGRSNAGIGSLLHLSAGGVEKHINAVFTKLGLEQERDAHRRVRAVLLFLRQRGSGEAG